MMGTLSVEVCVEMLNWNSGIGLRRLEAGARKMTSERFDEVMATTGFMHMEEETFRSILEERGVNEVTTLHAMRLLWAALHAVELHAAAVVTQSMRL